MVEDVGLMLQGLGFRVEGSGFRVKGLGFRLSGVHGPGVGTFILYHGNSGVLEETAQH
jgi:hypothetical protein